LNSDHIHTFTVETSIPWHDFVEKACGYFNKRRDEVILGYRISRDRRRMVLLTCELDWKTALRRVKDKVVVARTCAVTMEIKNMMVSTTIA
jgi:hypothetical protein